MKYDHFVNAVVTLAQLPSHGDAIKIIRATLETLAERLKGGEADHLASQLPEEIGVFLKNPEEQGGEAFSIDEFFKRVQRRSGIRMEKLVHQVHAVTEVLKEAVSPNEMMDMYAQLPYEFRQLFDAGPINESSSEIGHT
jgi:uncharacterized protein (DUF2267 family)